MAVDHEIKIMPFYFQHVVEGRKTFEIRKNDRDYGVGDHVLLREYDGSNYTGRSVLVQIQFITAYEQKPDFVVWSFKKYEDEESPTLLPIENDSENEKISHDLNLIKKALLQASVLETNLAKSDEYYKIFSLLIQK